MTGFEFHFLRPYWLLMLAPLALLLWRRLRSGVDGDTWRKVVDAHLLPRLLVDSSGRVRRLPSILLGLGWLLLVLALAGPTWERLPEPLYQARQYRVVALDLSPSMNATDVAPSRLARARFEVLDLLRYSDEGQTALLAYGAEPYIVSPLTTDAATIAAQVPNLETGLLPVPGARRTDLALDLAGQLLRQAEAPDGEVVLITDGLEHPAAAAEAARRLHADGYRVSVLGVGTAKGGPLRGPDGNFLKDANGAIRLPRLDAAVLRSVADAGGGRYVAARPDDRDIAALARRGAATSGDQAEGQDNTTERWREEGPWLLLVLLPLAGFAFRRGWLSPLVLVACVLPAPDAYALTWDDLWSRPDQRAQRLLEDGRPDAAAEVFERPDWRAAAQYRAKDYERALQTLQDLDGADSDYNRGNTLAHLGRLEEAVAAYDRTLKGQPQHTDARHNRDLVRRLIEQRRQASNRPDPEQSGDRQQESDQAQQQDSSQAQQEDADQGQQDDSNQAQQDESSQAEQGDSSDSQQQDSGQVQPDDQAQSDDQGAQDGQPQQEQAAQQDQAQAAPGGQDDSQAQSGQQPQPQSAGQDAGSEQQESAHTQTDDSSQQSSGGQDPQRDSASQGSTADQQAAENPAAEQMGDQQVAEQESPDGQQAREQAAARSATNGEQTKDDAEGDGQQAQQADAAQPEVRDGRSSSAESETGHQQAGESGEDTLQQAQEAGQQSAQTGTPSATGQDAGDGSGRESGEQQPPGGSQSAQTDTPSAAGERQAEGTPSQATAGGPAGQPQPAPSGPPSAAPGLADLMHDERSAAEQQAARRQVQGMNLEDRQAIDQMLRRVEDDPGGLLRQRFLLQHLRRSGRLP